MVWLVPVPDQGCAEPLEFVDYGAPSPWTCAFDAATGGRETGRENIGAEADQMAVLAE